MTGRTAIRVGLVLLLFLTVQQTLVLDIRISGVHPDIMLLLPSWPASSAARPGAPRWDL